MERNSGYRARLPYIRTVNTTPAFLADAGPDAAETDRNQLGAETKSTIPIARIGFRPYRFEEAKFRSSDAISLLNRSRQRLSAATIPG